MKTAENESQLCDKSDQQVDWHYSRIKAIQRHLSGKEDNVCKTQGNLMARVFLRATGAVREGKTYIIQEQDIFAWFENGDYLQMKTEYDTL